MKKKVLQLLLMGMFVIFSSSIYAQIKVSGIVKSSTGEVLPGATVIVKGTSTGALAGPDGKYTISVPNAQSTLLFTFIGMGNQEVPLNGRTVVDITMAQESIAMGEVVVTALGMKKQRKALGYNISSVNSENIETGGVSNALKSLEGKVTGVQMNSLTSSPTSSVMVNIRGATSLKGIMQGSSGNINNETQPLIVLNGIPVSTNKVGTSGGIDVGNYMSSINPNDIESISILKGASASALYGASAGNGVIMITTKVLVVVLLMAV